MKRSSTCFDLRGLEEYKDSSPDFEFGSDAPHPRVKRQNSGLPRLMGSASVSGGLGFGSSARQKQPPSRGGDKAAAMPLGLLARVDLSLGPAAAAAAAASASCVAASTAVPVAVVRAAPTTAAASAGSGGESVRGWDLGKR